VIVHVRRRGGIACLAARVCGIALALGALLAPVCARAAGTPGEYEVKAALLYNFARFVTWPAGAFSHADSPFVIGVVGDDPFGSALERTLGAKSIGGRPIVIRRWPRARDRGACHILFVAASERAAVRRLLAPLAAEPVLTVSDMPGFAADGGIVGLRLVDSRITFEINEDHANAASLSISSRLLSLARLVATDQ